MSNITQLHQPTPRARIPDEAREGEEIEIRTLIDHPMITAVAIEGPRDMLARFEARLNGATVFAQSFANGSAANPTATFFLRAAAPGALSLIWTHEDGRVFTLEHRIRIL